MSVDICQLIKEESSKPINFEGEIPAIILIMPLLTGNHWVTNFSQILHLSLYIYKLSVYIYMHFFGQFKDHNSERKHGN